MSHLTDPQRHRDPGLQPERTILAWGRTLMAMVVVAAIFLRWVPAHGAAALALIPLVLIPVGLVYLTQRRRYLRMDAGIRSERIEADVWAVFATSAAIILTGVLGILVVLLWNPTS
ncbi:DUF202 domain-containing protein [Haematomicrobium sanguinis]|uniref:DUF202 domain-containing protein n=1 Tax=Haematomicrobium sanguinis TaxID=479106 RepID=UPI00047A360E|nr:DUF202 domain-containing protein [Haematomicrobium sanguinis]